MTVAFWGLVAVVAASWLILVAGEALGDLRSWLRLRRRRRHLEGAITGADERHWADVQRMLAPGPCRWCAPVDPASPGAAAWDVRQCKCAVPCADMACGARQRDLLRGAR